MRVLQFQFRLMRHIVSAFSLTCACSWGALTFASAMLPLLLLTFPAAHMHGHQCYRAWQPDVPVRFSFVTKPRRYRLRGPSPER